MIPLASALEPLAAHPRAVPWRVEYRAGMSGLLVDRPFSWFAPPTSRASAVLMQRIHNGIVLLQPAAVKIHAPLPAADIRGLAELREIHHVPIVLGHEAEPVVVGRDLPAMEDNALVEPGPGLAVGLDLGGTGMKACALRPDETVLRTASAATWPDGEEGIESLVRRARALVIEVAGGQPIGSLGIGLASPMGVNGTVLELSTVMRAKLGNVAAFDLFAQRVAEGLVNGPVAVFNDLINLGRLLSADGARRLVRVQIGTSFGGCWIDHEGAVVATEMARLVIDGAPDARRHPYLPLSGAARAYLSTSGIAADLSTVLDEAVDARMAGLKLRDLLHEGDSRGVQVMGMIAEELTAAVAELAALLMGIQSVEVGGSMLQGPAGAMLEELLRGRTAVPVRIASRPGHDGAIASARAPRVSAPLKAMRRVG